MAKEEAKKHEAGKHEGSKRKLHIKGLTIHKAEDGGHVMEHHYEDHRGMPQPSRFGGVASNMADLHQHIDDHLGDGAAEQEAEPEDGGEPQGGAPGGAPPNAGAPEPEE